MGYQPRTNATRVASRVYSKSVREKVKNREPGRRGVGNSKEKQFPVATAEEVTSGTLRRLHVLGSQRFASSPFSAHFGRWLSNITDVVGEFESNPNINVDVQFVRESAQIFSTIERRLGERHREEDSVEEDSKILSDSKKFFEQIKEEYVTTLRAFKARKKK
jgi:hypothetical protein